MTHRSTKTHTLTVRRSVSSETGGYDTVPESSVETIVEGERVRYSAKPTELRRYARGESVDREYVIEVRSSIGEKIREGDSIELSPINAASTHINDVEVSSLEPIYGRRSRPERVLIHLEDI